MKIALCSTFVPFIGGGYRNIIEWLQSTLEEAGHQVERVYLPEVDQPQLLFQQMAAFRWIDLSDADRVICFRPQSHLIRHPHKIVWFIHHIRSFYDLWDTPYRGFQNDLEHQGIRDALREADTSALMEAKHVFTNSQVVSDRLQRFNNIESEVLYPPVFREGRYHCRSHNDEIVYVARLEHHKRQHLLVEAMRYTRSPIRLRLCGSASNVNYSMDLRRIIDESGLRERVYLEDRWISEEEKIKYFADCLASAYLPLDEDSYGYPSVEASLASKAVLTTTDAGGVLELVSDGVNGYITEPDPQAIAKALDKLYFEREKTIEMGRQAKQRLADLNISWVHVLDRLLS